MKKIGLVLAGGGGKGSYEIGVWKYLHEIGLDKYVGAVSGTSVGALNAALFVGNSYESAEKLWLNISPGTILTPKMPTMHEMVVNSLFPFRMLTHGFSDMLFVYDSAFSRKGMKKMISNGLDFASLKSSGIPCFVTCTQWPLLRVKRFNLEDYSEEDITKLLLASSAIPYIFPSEKFHGGRYYDGGIPMFGDNVPITPIYEWGAEVIIVVHLSKDTLVNERDFPRVRLLQITPRGDMGGPILGTLDFSKKGANHRLNMGYEDAKYYMKSIVDEATNCGKKIIDIL